MGDEAVESLFSDIWYQYYPRLHVFIKRMSIRPADVDDAVQEAMLKVYRNLKAYSVKYAVSTWIYSIARNHCLDMLRKERTQLKVVAESHREEYESPYRGPEETLILSERANQLNALIESLDQQDQQLVFLRFFEEMPYREISSVLSIPVGTLKYRIHSIRRKLRDRKEALGV